MKERNISKFTITKTKNNTRNALTVPSREELTVGCNNQLMHNEHLLDGRRRSSNSSSSGQEEEKFLSQDSVEVLLRKMQGKVRFNIQFSKQLRQHENVMSQVIHHAFVHKQIFPQNIYLRNFDFETSNKHGNLNGKEEQYKNC